MNLANDTTRKPVPATVPPVTRHSDMLPDTIPATPPVPVRAPLTDGLFTVMFSSEPIHHAANRFRAEILTGNYRLFDHYILYHRRSVTNAEQTGIRICTRIYVKPTDSMPLPSNEPANR